MGADEPPSLALATVLSGLTGLDQTEIGPLNRYVDLEALDEVLDPPGDSTPWTVCVRVLLDGYELTIDEEEVVVSHSDVERRGSNRSTQP